MSEQAKGETDSKRRVIVAGTAAAVGATAYLAFKELSRRKSLSVQEALEQVTDPDSYQHSTRVRILAALFNQPCLLNEKLQAASKTADNSLFEQTLQSLTDYYLDKYALVRGTPAKTCETIQRAHYELTPFASDAWNDGLFDGAFVTEVMAVREELSGNL